MFSGLFNEDECAFILFKLMFKQGNKLIKTVCINFASFTIIITSLFSTTDLTLKILLVLADYRIRLQTSDVNSCMVIIFVLSFLKWKIAMYMYFSSQRLQTSDVNNSIVIIFVLNHSEFHEKRNSHLLLFTSLY